MCFLKNTNFSIRIFYLIEMFSCGNFVALYKHFQLLVFTLKWCNKKLKTYENIQFFCVSNWRDTTLFIVKKVQKSIRNYRNFFAKKVLQKSHFFIRESSVFLAANRQTTGRVSSAHPPYKPCPS